MADISQQPPFLRSIWRRIDGALKLLFAILIGLLVFAPDALLPVLQFAGKNIANTAPFIAFAVFLIAYLRAAGAEAVIAKAFQGKEIRMVILASLVGGLAPFCSCEVIPFIAALLAMGTPLSAVMAFWLSSPIMDPPMFVITSSALGIDFAVAKSAAAVGMGLLGGGAIIALRTTGLFDNPLKETPASSGCGCGPNPFDGKAVWAFWTEQPRVKSFIDAALENAFFLLKWLSVAYLIEGIMIRFVPAEWIAGALGGDGVSTIALGALLGAPAYLNGYAAVPLVQGLIEQGMSQGAAMSFMLAGSVSSIPAAIAVWALVKPRAFAAYLGLGFLGALCGGLIWSAIS